jgi:hypothetical protein
MKLIKVIRQFAVENKIFLKDQEVEVTDNFAGSPRYYKVISNFNVNELLTNKRASSRKKKRIPDRQLKYHNSAITNEDKK